MDNEVFFALFLAPKVKKICRNGKPSMMSFISLDQRRTLCKDMLTSTEHIDLVYNEPECVCCLSKCTISLSKSQIVYKSFKLSDLVHHPIGNVTHRDCLLGGFVTYKEVFNKIYGNRYVCPECYEKFLEDVDNQACEILNREDRR